MSNRSTHRHKIAEARDYCRTITTKKFSQITSISAFNIEFLPFKKKLIYTTFEDSTSYKIQFFSLVLINLKLFFIDKLFILSFIIGII
jgi:hypothetical protein